MLIWFGAGEPFAKIVHAWCCLWHEIICRYAMRFCAASVESVFAWLRAIGKQKARVRKRGVAGERYKWLLPKRATRKKMCDPHALIQYRVHTEQQQTLCMMVNNRQRPSSGPGHHSSSDAPPQPAPNEQVLLVGKCPPLSRNSVWVKKQ